MRDGRQLEKEKIEYETKRVGLVADKSFPG